MKLFAPIISATTALAGSWRHAPFTVPDSLPDLARAAEAELTGNILPYWLANARDPATGGFVGEISSDGRRRRTARRGGLLTSRILWTFATAYARDRRAEHLEMARYAYADLRTAFRDARHGGIYWSATADGAPLSVHKHIYLQAFAIYGFAAYHRATGEAEALEEAIALYRLVETHMRDPLHGGYHEAMSRDWVTRQEQVPDGMPAGATKTQNSMLHLMEAYTALIAIWPDARLRDDFVHLTGEMMDRVFNARTSHLGLVFDADWTPVSDEISYGHDIECSWLLTDAATATGDAVLIARAREISLALARATLAAVDADGGLAYLATPAGVTEPQRQWWVQAEAVVGFLDAHELSGEAQYRDAALRAWGFIVHRVIDRRGGEWFGDVTVDGKPLRGSPKLGFWKCPYHNARACMEIVDRVGRPSRVEPAAVNP